MELKIGDFIEVYDIFADLGKQTLASGKVIDLRHNICTVKPSYRPAMVFDLNLELWRKVSPLEIELI